jgi:D-alanine-D-alanine ligase-like ATP-grasp enzyme
MMVDKYAVKDYVANMIGKEYIIPTLSVWDKPEEIDFESLPNQFVLKTTHGGGSVGVIICRNKEKLNKATTISQLKRAFRQDIYKESREWPYKNVRKKVLAERYMEDKSGSLKDYKVLCFSGKARLIELHSNRFSNHHTQDFYDTNWKKTNISQGGISTVSNFVAPRPDCLKKMLELSEALANKIPHCRVDWYTINDKLYFGEITFFDAGGFEPFDRKEDEEKLGSWINLPL